MFVFLWKYVTLCFWWFFSIVILVFHATLLHFTLKICLCSMSFSTFKILSVILVFWLLVFCAKFSTAFHHIQAFFFVLEHNNNFNTNFHVCIFAFYNLPYLMQIYLNKGNSFFLDNIIVLLLIVFCFFVDEHTHTAASKLLYCGCDLMFSVPLRWFRQTWTTQHTSNKFHTKNKKRTKLFDEQHKRHDKHEDTLNKDIIIHTEMTKMTKMTKMTITMCMMLNELSHFTRKGNSTNWHSEINQ